MKVTYHATFHATCPVDGTTDFYQLEVVSDQAIPVESILDVIRNATNEPRFQEDITAEIAEELRASVTSRGTHSGVETVVEC